MTESAEGRPPHPWNNGLLAASYVPLTDVAAPLAPTLLTALERARIAAYLAETADGEGALRLYVASGERSDARTIVAAVVRASGSENDPSRSDAPATSTDPLAGIDADAAFAALVADWHVDTHAAIREAERDLSREDEDWRLRIDQRGTGDELTWLDEDHFVPPNPPPLPRPTAPIVIGLALIVVSIFLLGFGWELGLPGELSLFLGVCGFITALTLFVLRLRAYRDEDDDGAVL